MGTYLVTGANRGIGLEYCRQLKACGEDVIAVCRAASLELSNLGIRVATGIELTQDADIERLKQIIDDQTIDVLINNAAIVERFGLEDLDVESLRQQFEVNAITPLKFTRALLPNLKAGSKVIMMTSRMGSIEDNTSGGSYELPHV